VRFLFEVELAKNPGIRQFLLWVFDKNDKAIRLYERMGFRYVTRQNIADRSGREELRYEYLLEPDARGVRAARGDRRADLRTHGRVSGVMG
jgi:RimJ/RimL family protein N-acetyltransferase